MFKRSFRSKAPAAAEQPAHRVHKSSRLMKRSGGTTITTGGGGANEASTREAQRISKLERSLSQQAGGVDVSMTDDGAVKPVSLSPIVTLSIGWDGRLFAAHEDVLCKSLFFEALVRGTPPRTTQPVKYRVSPDPSGGNNSKRIALPDEDPEIFSAVLEYLYKGDYYPNLLPSKQHANSWELEDSAQRQHQHQHQHRGATPATSPHHGGSPHGGSPHHAGATVAPSPASVEATVYLASAGQHLLRDTVIYCAADRYGLEELKRLALRKQGLQGGIDVGTIIRSAQYCYAHTPDSDSRLRAHYLALIIRCRKTFKRSGTMQAEMEKGGEGGKLFFDLFVALCNHLDDVIDASNSRTPKTI